ncbi:MAG: amino acid adenylation domain-containing protein, partial [Lachnospiraceae bacterium]|nr:amino acid adenylation domain-containing protein [Lachnospiraceae bacterium]
MTYNELLHDARALGSLLSDKVGHCDGVGFFLEKSNIAVKGMFGVVYAGGFYSVFDVRSPITRINKIIETLKPAVILTDEKNKEKSAELVYDGEILVIEDLLKVAKEDDEKLAVIRAEALDIDPLYVNFTSGSTGVPKGVTVAHRSVIEFSEYFTDIFKLTEDDIFGNQAPFDFDVSVKDIYSSLLIGAKVQIIPRDFFSFPTQLMDYLVEKKVTTLVWAVSAMCFVSIMNGFDYKVPTTVKRVMFSGEVLPVKHLKVWKKYLPDATYVNLYGPTEITCNCTYYVLDREFEDSDVIPAGKPFPNERVFLLDENDKEVTSPDVTGEITVSGTAVVPGYYNDRERTALSFVQNPLQSKYIEIVYRTGDIGKYDKDGNLIYVSRKDFQIKHMGQRIELGEIEAITGAVKGIDRVVCIYDHEKKKIKMFYTGEADKKELMKELRVLLPPYMMPNSVTPLEEMPLNKNGKIDRRALNDR